MSLPNLLTEDDLDRLHWAILRVLERTGSLYQSERILKALEKAGGVVDWQAQTARLPRWLVEDILEERRRQSLRADESRQSRRFAEGEYRVGINLHIAQFYHDYDRQERRESNRQDYITLLHFGDAWDANLPVSQVLLLREEPPLVEPLEGLALLLEHVRNPGYTYPHYAEQFPYLEEIGEIYASDWRRFLVGGIFMVSPLRMDRRACNFLVARLERGLDCSIGTQPVSGVSAPVTIAGNVVQAACEIISGWAACKAIRADARLSGGICSGVLDMRACDVSFCSPEAMLQDIACVELFRRRYGGGVGIAGGANYTDAKLPGLQATFERTFEAMAIAWFTGSLPHVGSGLLESGKTFSPVQFILDQELGGFLWQFCQRIEVNDETLAADVIESVGWGAGVESNFLSHEHTLFHFHKALWHPQFLDRGAWQSFAVEAEAQGQMLDAANLQFHEVLAQYKPPDVDSDMLQKVRAVVERARRELVG